MGFLSFYITSAPIDVCPLGKGNRSSLMYRSKNPKVVVNSKEMEDGCILEICQHKQQTIKNFALTNTDETMNFPFLTDNKTIQHIKHSKTMFIMRGLPGSGKSTIVRNIQLVYPDSAICSADNYFYTDGVYTFNALGLKDAHASSQQKARKSCESEVAVVVIDNTNVRRWEMKVYFDLARQFGYTVVIVEPKTAWKFDPKELAKRNKHCVGEDVLRGKVSQFDRLSPVYFGWFLTEKGSKDLTFIAKVLFYECLKKCQDYRQSMKDVLPSLRNSTVKQSNEDDLIDYFPWKNSADNYILHCTAKFCNKGRAPGAAEYLNRKDVNQTLGQASNLQIVGFVFTRNTVGARLQLTEHQLSLFDKPEERERDEIQTRNAAVNQHVAAMYSLSTTKTTETDNYQIQPSSKESKPSNLSAMSQPTGFGRSAHITICNAHGVKPSQTIFDLLDICDKENFGSKATLIPVMGGVAADFGDGFCPVYLYKPITVSSLFSAFYV